MFFDGYALDFTSMEHLGIIHRVEFSDADVSREAAEA